MDFLHRRPQERDTRTGQECEFCSRLDPEFSTRRLLDKIVHSDKAMASAHLTENGYVKHRMIEIQIRVGGGKPPINADAA